MGNSIYVTQSQWDFPIPDLSKVSFKLPVLIRKIDFFKDIFDIETTPHGINSVFNLYFKLLTFPDYPLFHIEGSLYNADCSFPFSRTFAFSATSNGFHVNFAQLTYRTVSKGNFSLKLRIREMGHDLLVSFLPNHVSFDTFQLLKVPFGLKRKIFDFLTPCKQELVVVYHSVKKTSYFYFGNNDPLQTEKFTLKVVFQNKEQGTETYLYQFYIIEGRRFLFRLDFPTVYITGACTNVAFTIATQAEEDLCPYPSYDWNM